MQGLFSLLFAIVAIADDEVQLLLGWSFRVESHSGVVLCYSGEYLSEWGDKRDAARVSVQMHLQVWPPPDELAILSSCGQYAEAKASLCTVRRV